MYMARVTCVNWGNLPNSDYALGPVTLLTGGSGTGKTTMADAIQSVMTGVKRNLYTYNPGQDEATQHGRHGKTPRSLASYILGCDDNAYARPKGAYGYVALVFAPSPGEPEGKVFTAILGVKAFLETVERAGGRRLRTSREEQTRLVVVEGHGIGLSDLIAAREAGMIRPVPTDAVVTALRQRYGDACVNDFSDNKSAYLCKLYGLLRGRPSVSTDEAEKAARTFSRFMAYKPIESIDTFVRTQILEPRDMAAEIDNIAGMMRKVQELRTDSERLTRNIALLEDAERDTRISRRYLQALETEQFDVIPAPVYARGFLRSYSQYLGLDPQEMLALFDDVPEAARATPPLTTVRQPHVEKGALAGHHGHVDRSLAGGRRERRGSRSWWSF